MASLLSSTTRQSQETPDSMERTVPDPHQTFQCQLLNSKHIRKRSQKNDRSTDFSPTPAQCAQQRYRYPDQTGNPAGLQYIERPAAFPPDCNLKGGNSGRAKILTTMNTVIRVNKQVVTALRMISCWRPTLLQMPHTHDGTLFTPDQHLIIITTRCE